MLEEKIDRQTEIVPLMDINTIILKSQLLNSVTRIDASLPRTYLKPQNFRWIKIFSVEFYKVMPVANIFLSYWS